nr:hypothetical protein [Myxococcota bacterium]
MRAPICSDDVIERAFCDPDVIAQAWASAGAVVDEAVGLEEHAASPSEALVAIVRMLGARGLLGLIVPAELGGTYEHVRSTAI